MKKNFYKKIFVIGAALFILFAPAGITVGGFQASVNSSSFRLVSLNFNVAFAASKPGIWSWTFSPATSAIALVSYVVDNIMALAVMLGAFLVRLGLQFNENIFNSPAVQTGFSVSLAIANLGFVLGIIVIAIATILRNQTYGIKQLLWKLVFMAILVNFGLVVTAPIVGFADSMSNYFINATSPSSATGGYEAYIATMAGAFAPQTMTPDNTVTSANCSQATGGTAALCKLQQGTAAKPDSPSSFTQTVLSMVFGIAFLALTAFTFICLAILLIIRYLMLGGLLIVLPLAWLTYIFPKFDNSFSKWWNTFIKWTFFPPLALFFIYLAFITAANTGGAASQNAYLKQAAGLPANAQSGPEGALVYQTGLTGAVQQAADEILLVGLTIMGLMFANSLTGKAGSMVVNGATHASKAAAGYVGKKGLRVAGRAVPQKLKENLQAGKIPLVPQRLQVATGVGLGKLEKKGRGDMVLEEAKNAESLAKDPQSFARILSSKAGSFGTGATSKQGQMAMLAQLAKDEDLQKEVAKQGNMVGGVGLQKFLKDNEGEFKRLQQDKLYETLKDKSGLTPLDLAQKNEGPQKTIQDLGDKVRLQEIKEIKKSANEGTLISPADGEKLAVYEKRKKELEDFEKSGEGMHESEEKELTEIRTMEKTSGQYATAEEKEQYKKAQDEFTETNNKLKAWVAKNPDIAADTFQDHDRAIAKLKAEGKPVPLTFEPESVKQLQKSMLTAMAEGFSPQNAKGLIEAVGKKNNLKYLEESTDNMDKNTIAQIRSLAMANKPLATWISKNAGRNMVDLNQMFGIAAEKRTPKNANENEDS